ncbi:glycosyltransferase family 1 protein [Acinetobacter sp. VNH17]|uniref:Glycosyltransferase family 1 protein n=1 Tax=Acinetobacter thutiue TaxID=2998078 RepID=A0ABT7WSR1_9GAMM|nr:glycosyltransferase family 1 protein [Acinetobacter thutiue]MCY6413622.1 glycosyltransferase family 1 protein [Acinetobacter thutiue]MDN0015731.1 glycosyltransferase family 1 protein [Acinetobacter thutiue]
MQSTYATSLLKQDQFPENFKFYFKRKQQNDYSYERAELRDLVRPRLRIAIVTETWPPEINGVALSMMQLCQGLQRLGHKILLVRPVQKETCAEFHPEQECRVLSQPIPKYPSLQFGWPQYLKVTKAFEKFSPDVVHIVTEGPLGLTALQAAKAKKIAVSSGFHSPFQDFSRFFDLAFLVKPIQRYLTWFHNSTDVTCVPSQHTEQALRGFGVTCPLVVVGRGVDTARFSPKHRSQQLRQQWGVDADTRVMLYVGRLSPEKEVDVLIKSFHALQAQQGVNIKFVIVGDGPDRVRLSKMTTSKDVIFMGSLSGHELATAYASADVFTFASQADTFGNVVLEAIASGLPVIAYDYVCAHQHVKHNITGWLSPLGHTAELIQSICRLPALLQLRQMGLLASESVQHSSWQFPVQQLEQALYQVVKESPMTST